METNWYAIMENSQDVYGIFPSRILASITGKQLIKDGLLLADEAFTCKVYVLRDGSFQYDIANRIYFNHR